VSTAGSSITVDGPGDCACSGRVPDVTANAAAKINGRKVHIVSESGFMILCRYLMDVQF
jgi:hypothetical protein